MSENLNLGQIITTPQQRDAIHIAVVPMVAGETLNAGNRVLVEGDKAVEAPPSNAAWVGVVDPYLESSVRPGQRFWLFLRPGSITSLRHDWTHPALDGTPDVVAARGVIERMASDMGLSYHALIDYGRGHAKGWDDGYVVQQGSEEWRDSFDATTFWPAFEIVTGEKVPEDKKDHFFSCSC